MMPLIMRQLKVQRVMYSPQLAFRLSLAARRLYLAGCGGGGGGAGLMGGPGTLALRSPAQSALKPVCSPPRGILPARPTHQGILLLTWCGTCTLMSWHRNSTQRGYSQSTVPDSCACRFSNQEAPGRGGGVSKRVEPAALAAPERLSPLQAAGGGGGGGRDARLAGEGRTCAAFHWSAGLKGMCGAVWCTTVKVDIQKWYPSHGISLQGFV